MLTTTNTRTEYRFTGNDQVVYGRGLTKIDAIDDAQGHISEPLMTQADIDENGYIAEVEQQRDPVNGEWVDAD